jgi:hypothetical protein
MKRLPVGRFRLGHPLLLIGGAHFSRGSHLSMQPMPTMKSAGHSSRMAVVCDVGCDTTSMDLQRGVALASQADLDIFSRANRGTVPGRSIPPPGKPSRFSQQYLGGKPGCAQPGKSPVPSPPGPYTCRGHDPESSFLAFQVGYLTVNPDVGEGSADWKWLWAQPGFWEPGCVHLRFASPPPVLVSGRSRSGNDLATRFDPARPFRRLITSWTPAIAPGRVP